MLARVLHMALCLSVSVTVLDVSFLLLLCFYIEYILVTLAQSCAILLFYGHLSAQEFLPGAPAL